MVEQKIELVPLQFIKPLPANVTKIGRDEDMMLRADMTRTESKGLYKIDPILIRRLSADEIEKYKKKHPWAKYEIIDGFSRWSAARELGWTRIRTIITDATREEALEINYKKNKARGNVDPLREAMYFKHLREDQKWSQDKIAEKFGVTQQRVSQILKRIKVTKEARRALATRVAMGKPVSGKHLEVIASVPEPEKQAELTKVIIEEKLSWREAEQAKEAVEKGLSKEEVIKIAKKPAKPTVIETEQTVECPICHQQFILIHDEAPRPHKLKPK